MNHDRINQPTTRRKWPEPAASVLADDPTLFAAGGAHGEFQVLYSRLAKDRLSLADERIVTSRLLKDHPYSLFVFSDRTQTNWHFLNVKMAETPEKRKLFRRITIGPSEKLRTASQIVSQLDLATISPNLFGLSPLIIQERHDQAFDVEPVTEELFRQYHRIAERARRVNSSRRQRRPQLQRNFAGS